MAKNKTWENIDDKETKEEKEKREALRKQWEERAEFLNEFSKQTWPDFLKKLLKASSLSDFWIRKLLEDFKSKNYKFKNLDINKITLKDLKEKFSSDLLSLDLWRKSLISSIDADYELDKSQRKEIIEKVEDLDIKELWKLSEDKDKRDEFLKKNLKIKSVLEIEKPELYNELLEYFSKEKIEKLPKDKQNKIYKLLNELKPFESDYSLWERQKIALKELLQLDGIFDNDFKRKILKRYVPFLKLSDFKSFLDEEEYKEFLEDFIFSYFHKNFPDIDIRNYDFDKLLKLVERDGVKIDSKFILNYFEDKSLEKLFKDSSVASKISDSFVNQYNNSINNWKKRLEDEIESFDHFKNILSEYWLEAEKFKPGSILKIQVESKEWFVEQYYRIDSIDEDNKKINFSIVWLKLLKDTKAKITNNPTEKDIKSFLDIVNLLKTNERDNDVKVDLKLYNSDDFKEIIKDEENFEVSYDSIDSVSVEDLKEDKKLQEKVKNELIEAKRSKIENLEKELSSVEEELSLLWKKEWIYKDLSSDELEEKKKILNTKKQKLELFIQDEKKEINKLSDDDLDIEELAVFNNFNNLVKKIDNLDSDWKSLGLEKWIEIEFKDEKWNYISFEVVWINKEIDDQSIVLKNVRSAKEETISYEDFYQAFKKNKAKRVEKINTFQDFLNKNSEDESWKNLKIKSWELIQEDVEFNDENWNRQTEDKKIEYLVWDKWELIKIEDFWDWELEVRFWELETEEKEKWKDKKINHNIKLTKDTEKISYNELQKLISEKKYVPDWEIWKKFKTKYPEDYQNDLKWSFSARFWNRKSIAELIQWWKMLVDGITESLKRWNDIRAAEFALWISKILLPGEIAEDFEAQVEMNQSEAMEKELTKLWKIDSKKATSRVLKWIKNKDTPEFRKEAGLMYMAKYWVLYAKMLAPYKWSFLWYEALWGRVWDELYKKVQNEALREWLPFDEKELLIQLLTAQSRGELKPKRRSKFYKEFKWKIAAGFNDENNDWYNDAKDKRTIGQIIQWWMWEVYGWTLPNGLAWARRAVEKWGSLEDMNHIYFTLIYSWALYDAPSNILENQLKTDWQWWNSMLLAWFGSTLWWQKLFNKTVKDLSLKIARVEPNKYPDIDSDALEIYNAYNNKSIPHNEKIEKTEKFWKKYWKVLSRALYMVDDDNTEYAKTDKLIFFWRDHEFKEYYNSVKENTDAPYVFWKDFMEDAVWESWAADTNIFKVLEHHFSIDQTLTFRNKSIVEVVWPKILSWFNATPEKIKNNPEDKEKYKEYVNTKLRQVVWGLLSWVWKDRVNALDTVDPVWHDLQSFWIKPSSFWGVKIEDILNWTVWKEIFDRATENILTWRIVEVSEYNSRNVFDEVEKIKKVKDLTVNNAEYVLDEAA